MLRCPAWCAVFPSGQSHQERGTGTPALQERWVGILRQMGWCFFFTNYGEEILQLLHSSTHEQCPAATAAQNLPWQWVLHLGASRWFVVLFGPHVHKRAAIHVINEIISIKFIKYYFFRFFLSKKQMFHPQNSTNKRHFISTGMNTSKLKGPLSRQIFNELK